MNWKFVPIAAVLLFPAAACAQSTEPDFATIDANGDQMISVDEAQADPQVAENFDSADANVDGNLSEEEFQVAFLAPEDSAQPGADN